MNAPRFAGWTQARFDVGRAQPGARALMRAITERWDGEWDSHNWGIYSARNTVLGNLSAHTEGRALDVGCPLRTGRQIQRRLRLLDPARLGISVIIHNGVIYSQRSPNGRAYVGVPHRDHVHIEMTRAAAANLTLARARKILNGPLP